MMATATPPNAEVSEGFTADIPEDVRRRIETAKELQEVANQLGFGRQRSLPQPNPKLTYAEPQNCTLHFISPTHEVMPSFGTVVGLSLCPGCLLRVADAVVDERLSAAELLELARMGSWLDEDVNGRPQTDSAAA